MSSRNPSDPSPVVEAVNDHLQCGSNVNSNDSMPNAPPREMNPFSQVAPPSKADQKQQPRQEAQPDPGVGVDAETQTEGGALASDDEPSGVGGFETPNNPPPSSHGLTDPAASYANVNQHQGQSPAQALSPPESTPQGDTTHSAASSVELDPPTVNDGALVSLLPWELSTAVPGFGVASDESVPNVDRNQPQFHAGMRLAEFRVDVGGMGMSTDDDTDTMNQYTLENAARNAAAPSDPGSSLGFDDVLDHSVDDLDPVVTLVSSSVGGLQSALRSTSTDPTPAAATLARQVAFRFPSSDSPSIPSPRSYVVDVSDPQMPRNVTPHETQGASDANAVLLVQLPPPMRQVESECRDSTESSTGSDVSSFD